MNIDADAELASARSSFSAAADQDRITAIQNGDKIGATAGDNMPVKEWMSNLPKNITVGVMDAAANAVHSAKVFGDATWEYWMRPNETQQAYNEGQGLSKNGETPEQLREKFLAQPSIEETHGPTRQAYQAFRDELAAGSTTSDNITQGIAQFAIPMLGFTKMFAVKKAVSAAGFLAEGLTASTAFEPHGGRNADLLAYGRTVEGKLGDALSTISPDGSALNAYINYMTDRTGESETEGRFKNVIDSLVTTTAGAALLKTGATTIKAARGLPSYIAQNAGGGPVGAAAQEGKIVFHGTPHNFDEFSSDKIGTGEGNQSYGHGLYFAEEPKTANTYRLTTRQDRRAAGFNSPMGVALQRYEIMGGDKQKTYVDLLDSAARETDALKRDRLNQAALLVKSGAVDRGRGKLMHVDIPDEHLAKMLDWDKPLSEQPDNVRAALGAYDEGTNPLGGAIYKSIAMGSSPEEAAMQLAHQGIPGIKYLDSGSRNAGEGTRNIVLFDAKHAKIVKKE